MLIIPVTGKLSLKNPPFLTVCLILVNFLVFFVVQRNDPVLYSQLMTDYFESGQAEIEICAYIEHTMESDAPKVYFDSLDEEKQAALLAKMMSDKTFQEQLENNEIIMTGNPVYEKWHHLREQAAEKRERIISVKYGFRPSIKSPVTYFTYMFLHGGPGHLIGNMLFLWIVGSILEIGCGRLFSITAYLVAGIASAILFGIVYSGNSTPLVGASGAISGIMGAFSTLYARQKVNVFYSVGVYFDYVKFPALALLPIWISLEFIRLFSGGPTNVAYVAHIGGLASGGVIGWMAMKYFNKPNTALFTDDPQKKIETLLDSALSKIGELNLEGGRKELIKIIEIDPQNETALTHLFNIDKQTPENRNFHTTAKNLIDMLARDLRDHETLYKIFSEYTSLCTPRLSPALYARIGYVFSVSGKTDEAEKILFMLISKKPETVGVAEGMLKLASVYGANGDESRQIRCLESVCRACKGTNEAGIATEAIARIGLKKPPLPGKS